jgi:hypothetical protein
MTKILILTASIICLMVPKKPSYNLQQNENVINVDFQYNFKNDTIDIKVNNILIVRHKVLNSGYVGFTDLSLKISRYNEKQYKIDYLDKFKYCVRSDKINLVVMLNGRISTYLLDSRNGKWIGLAKDGEKGFAFCQQWSPFIYE